ncbi:hypothetical protein JD844_003861 [Phrynosoma platyrhinos]|uniref:Uncharacterized protein n=1 Tax=Phrynosoma platyrhinos TaxID=52577 RepID=A0ABQ7TE70_PHRPL|nr:hypothetical protein JD844_003861 [Phrynosoma platyrhinos]
MVVVPRRSMAALFLSPAAERLKALGPSLKFAQCSLLFSGCHLSGVILSNGERWLQIRRFSLMTLRNFGMGKKGIEERIQEETEYLVKELRDTKGQPFTPTTLFSSAAGNVISHILFGERFDYQDKDFIRILRLLRDSVWLESSFAGQLYNIIPNIMEYLPGPHRKLFQDTLAVETFITQKIEDHKKTFDPSNTPRDFIDAFLLKMEQLYNTIPKIMDYLPGPHHTLFQDALVVQAFVTQKIEDHKKTFDPSNTPRDFIDAFLLKMEQEKTNPKTEFTMENLVMTVLDLYFAGTETSSTTLRYICMLLLEHPAVEAKIHEEIDRVIGRERPPAMKDRPGMPYTEAVIHEAQRFLDLIPMGVVRMAKRDVELEGFTIPKEGRGEPTKAGLLFLHLLYALHILPLTLLPAKIHEEIDRVIGRERPPAMKDRPGMPYTEAVIHEAQRFLDLIPLGLVRKAKRDVELEGFTIPKVPGGHWRYLAGDGFCRRPIRSFAMLN